jgi:hypothetical protein
MATFHYINPWLHLNAKKSSIVINTTDIYAVEYQDVEDGIKVEIKWEKRSLSFVMEDSDSVVSLLKMIECYTDIDSPTTFLVHKLKWNMSL